MNMMSLIYGHETLFINNTLGGDTDQSYNLRMKW